MLLFFATSYFLTCAYSSSVKNTIRKRYDSDDLALKQQECPSWTKDFTRNEKNCLNKKFLRITPLLGFGNKLNGILQGALGAYWLDRCLLINWSYGDLLSTYLQKEYTITGMKNLAVSRRPQNTKKISFPRSSKAFKKLKVARYSELILDMKVGYRDMFCTAVMAQQIDVGLTRQKREQLTRTNTLCVFLEKCILQNVVRPKVPLKISITKIKEKWMSNNSISIAAHIRMGDYISIEQEDQHVLKTGGDMRIPRHALDLFWKTVKFKAEEVLGKTEKSNFSIFMSADNQFALDDASHALGSGNVYHTKGSFRHSDLDYRNDSSAIKMLTDWFLLSEADIVIQGPWSTFVEKALVYSNRKQHIIRCHILPQMVNHESLILQKNGWGCFENVMKDTFKGPRAVDFYKGIKLT